MLGLSRNVWFGIGGVMLAVVLYLGFSGGDAAEGSKDAQAQKAKSKKGKGKRKKRVAGGGDGGGVGIGKVCARLDCSKEQLTAFKALVKEHRKGTAPQRRGLSEAHVKIAAELSEDTLDTAALDEAYADAAQQQAQLDASARGVLVAMHAQLSSAQREALAKMVARHGPTKLLARPSSASPARSKKGRKKRGRRRRKGKKKDGQAPAEAEGEAAADAPADGEAPEAPAPAEPEAPAAAGGTE